MQVNVTDLVWLAESDPFPPAALAIIHEAGPRPLSQALATPSTLADVNSLSTPAAPLAREVDLFLCCSLPANQWPGITSALAAHKNNLTGVIISPYSMGGDGSFGVQGGSADAEHAVPALRSAGVQRIKALCACSPSGVRRVIYNETAANEFIRYVCVILHFLCTVLYAFCVIFIFLPLIFPQVLLLLLQTLIFTPHSQFYLHCSRY